jgi:hypothetical protein
MNKWLDKYKQKPKEQSFAPADTMSTLAASSLDISKNNNNPEILKNPNPQTDSVDTVTKTSQTTSCQTQKITKKALQNFLGEDWQDYANKPEALKLWAEMLSKKEVMISLKVLTREQYENLFNQ